MSLVVYKYEEDIPDGVKYIMNNDGFFNSSVDLPTAEQVKSGNLSDKEKLIIQIMRDIDCAEPCDEGNFISIRGVGNVKIPKMYLSTGTKTAINILTHPTKYCFTLCECGDNVLQKIFNFTEGMVDWWAPYIESTEPTCDIMFNGYHYTDPKEAMDDIYEG